MTVAKKMELPVKNEKDRMIEEVNNLSQDIKDDAIYAGVNAIQTIVVKHCPTLETYLSKNGAIGGEEFYKWLLTGALGFSQTETETEQKLDKFFHLEAMDKLNRLIEEQNKFRDEQNKVVRFTKLQSKDN